MELYKTDIIFPKLLIPTAKHKPILAGMSIVVYK